MRVPSVLTFVWIALVAPANAEVPVRNGFSLEPASIPVDEILKGGPPRDGIPFLDHPAVIRAADAPWKDDDLVLGVEWNGEARAYPIAILEWHELVNDTLGGRSILVSYCPLCGTGIVFDRRAARHKVVSGPTVASKAPQLARLKRSASTSTCHRSSPTRTGFSVGDAALRRLSSLSGL